MREVNFGCRVAGVGRRARDVVRKRRDGRQAGATAPACRTFGGVRGAPPIPERRRMPGGASRLALAADGARVVFNFPGNSLAHHHTKSPAESPDESPAEFWSPDILAGTRLLVQNDPRFSCPTLA